MNKISKTNPAKASMRVNVNSFMMGSLFFILTLIWTLNPHKFSPIIIGQIVYAIPLLFVSSLAYSKIGYSEYTRSWDTFAWYTHNIGSIFILNVVGLMTALQFKDIAIAYFGLIVLLMGAYSIINLYNRPDLQSEKLFKFVVFISVLMVGGILPLAF
ncbi:MAG: hypothetical protein HZA95_01135 [Candidatus Vogelbacteria bacterium]|nr:hypothetical protein [Candidatus Vogelbacteria bacterium]